MADPVILLNMLAAGKIGPHRQIRGVKGGARMSWMLMIVGARSAQIKKLYMPAGEHKLQL